jgi:ubiquinone/menaquinone biosynthesis C-methylase UbiE
MAHLNNKKRLFVIVAAGAIAGEVLLSGQVPPRRQEHVARITQTRNEEVQPERLMEKIGVQPGMVIGEAGAGGGYLTFHLARKVGPQGRVYANDIESRALEILSERQSWEGLTNITAVLGESEDPLFPERDLDMIVMMYAYHEFANKVAWLKNARKYLKPGAPVVILEHLDDQDRVILPDDVEDEARQAGFELTLFENFRPTVNIFVLKAL